MARLRPSIVASIFLFCWAGNASARQTGTTEGQTADKEEQAAANERRGISKDEWSFSGGIGTSYDSNVLFIDGPAKTSDLAIRAQTGLRRSWTRPRGGVNLFGDVTRPFYQKTPSLGSLMYSFGGGFSYDLTQRLSWTTVSSVTSSLAQDSKVITDTGAVLPSVVARTGSTSTRFRYELSPRTQMTVNVSQIGVGFEATLLQPGGLSGGSILSSGVSFTRELSKGQTLGVTASYDMTFTDAGSAKIQSYLGTWMASFGRVWTIAASGGIRPYSIPGQAGYRIAPGANVALSRTIREIQTFSVTYERVLEQAFGIDNLTHQAQIVGVDYSVNLGSRAKAGFGGSYAYSTYPLKPDLRLIGGLANASLSYQLMSGLGITVGSAVFARRYTPNPYASTYRTSMSLAYGKSW